MSLHILILIYEYPPIGGGAGVIASWQAKYFAELGHRVSVVTSAPPKPVDFEETPNLEVVRLPTYRPHFFKSGIREKLDWTRAAKRYLKVTGWGNYDFCMAHFSIPGGLAAFNSPIPMGIISHGHDIPWAYPKMMFGYHLLLYPLIRSIVAKSRVLWVQSEEMERNARRFMAEHTVHKIPNGGFPNSSDVLTDLSKRPLRLLFAGRLVQQKRPDILLEMMRILKNKDVELSIAGDGPLLQKVKKVAEKNSLKIDFLGLISRDSMPKILRSHDVLIAPSEFEGMSISVLEALFAGLYVVASRASGNPDVIEGTNLGKLVDLDAQKFAEAVLGILEAPSENEARIFAWHTLRQSHHWKEIARQYLVDIEKITSQP
ncbi:MAG: glycosyltransferase family 1 protein [Flavobacteriales bacterium]|nr:MAG: glycosyltransferase family 1 protein [Flavobacteriales bacterium]